MEKAYVGEFIGTALLVLLGLGINANVTLKGTKGKGSGWIVITVGWATAVMVAVFLFHEISGAHFNPALTIALAVAGKFELAKVAGYIAAQFLGGMAGAFLVWVMYKDHFNVEENEHEKLGVFATAPAIRNPFINLMCEIIATFVMAFTLTSGVSQANDGGLAALGAWRTWAVILVIGMALGGTTGYAINPARDLSPRIMHAILPIKNKGNSNWGYAWIPVIGPVIGAIIGSVTSVALFG
ncbi:MAG: aquaporin family protein [Spirochaetaceae bacterium]|nr:aquaporin family protein [Spirochaetaceae bacterium]